MSDRLRNNVIAGFIVVAFWIVFVLPVMAADPIVTQATSNSTVTSNSTTSTTSTVKTNPPSAISPSLGANTDCTFGVSGSVQTSVVGISTGQTVRDVNCELLALSARLADLGLKIASVEILCLNDYRVFQAMEFSSTPCAIPHPETGKGLLGEEARAEWAKPENKRYIPKKENLTAMGKNDFLEKLISGLLGVMLLAILAI
jgi:hypothetical protein